MADLKLIGAVGVKVRPDTGGFRGATQRGISRELAGLDHDVKIKGVINVDVDKAKAEAEIANLKAKLASIDKTVNIRVNSDGLKDLKAAREQTQKIADAQKDANRAQARYADVIRINSNAILKAQQEYDKAVLNGMRSPGTQGDTASKLERLNYLKAEVEEHKKLAEAAADDYAGQKRQLRELIEEQRKARLARQNNPMLVTAEDNLRIEREFQDIQHKAKKTSDYIDDLDPKLHVSERGLLGVAAQLKYASRPRHTPILVTVDQKSLAIAEGMLKSLSGLNLFSEVGETMEKLLTRFDIFAVKGASLLTLWGNVGSVIANAATGAFPVVGDLSKILGLAALAPTGLAALAGGLVISAAAFKNFGEAVGGSDEHLAAIPPNARLAAAQLRGAWKEIQRPIQGNFWEAMGDSMSEATKVVIPQFSDGLAGAASGAGRFTKGVMDSFKKIALNGDMKTMFGNLTSFFDKSAGAASPLVDAINKIGLHGSDYLPRLADWLVDVSKKFDNLVTEDRVNSWIDGGVQTLKDAWDIGGSVIRMFEGLSTVARLAGHGGLADVRDSLSNVADIMNREPFRGRMVTILEGAGKGAGHLNDGLKNVFRTVGENSGTVSSMLDLLGQIGGGLLSDVSETLGNSKFQGGILNGLGGARDLVNDLKPTFDNLGTIIGGVSTLAGTVLSNVGKPIGELVALVKDVFETVDDNLNALVPALTDKLAGLVRFIGGPVKAGADLVNGILGVFNAMPGSMQAAVLGFAGFLALRGQFGNVIGGMTSKTAEFFNGLVSRGEKAPSAFAPLVQAWREQSALANSASGTARTFATDVGQVGLGRASLGNIATGFRDIRSAVEVIKTDGLRTGFREIATHAGNATRAIGTGGAQGLLGAAGGLMTALGGPWAIGLAVAGAGLGAFAQQQMDAQTRVKNLTKEIDTQTGLLTDKGKEQIAAHWMDIGTNPVDNLMRGLFGSGVVGNTFGNNVKSVTETIDQLGIKSADVNRKLADPKGREAYIKGLQNIIDAQAAGKPVTEEMANAIGTSAKKIEEVGGSSFGYFAAKVKESGTELDKAAEDAKRMADTLGLSEPQAKKLADAMAVIGDNSRDAASKIDAIRTSLDMLKGGAMSKREAEMASAGALNSAVDQAKAIAENVKGAGNTLFGEDGFLSSASRAGADLHQVLKKASDGILIEAQAAYTAAINAGQPAEVAAAEAEKVMDRHRDDLKKIADGAKVEVGKLQKDWEQLNGTPIERKVTFSAKTDSFLAAKHLIEQSGLEFSAEKFVAYLDANPDQAQRGIDGATDYARVYTEKQYLAKLEATAQPALDQIGVALGAGDVFRSGDYSAMLKAIDNASPEARATAQRILNNTPDRDVQVKATDLTATTVQTANKNLEQVTAPNVKLQIDYKEAVSETRKAFIEMLREIPLLSGILDILKGRVPGQRAGLNGGVMLPGMNFQSAYPLAPVKYFANGGIENHVAQIAMPGATPRVWLEKETEGEAYIPLAASKRTRSTAILRDVANRFGYELAPKGAQFFADGAVMAPSRRATESSSGASFQIGEYHQHTNSTPDDVVRAFERRARTAPGGFSPTGGF